MTWWQKLFYGFKKEPDPEFSPTPEEERGPQYVINRLIKKGFHLKSSEEGDYYERVWVVATQDGAERSREVYVPMGSDGRWRVIMYGNNNEIFFEQGLDVYGDPVPYDEHVNRDGLNNERPEMFGNIVKKDEGEDE